MNFSHMQFEILRQFYYKHMDACGLPPAEGVPTAHTHLYWTVVNDLYNEKLLFIVRTARTEPILQGCYDIEYYITFKGLWFVHLLECDKIELQ